MIHGDPGEVKEVSPLDSGMANEKRKYGLSFFEFSFRIGLVVIGGNDLFASPEEDRTPSHEIFRITK